MLGPFVGFGARRIVGLSVGAGFDWLLGPCVRLAARGDAGFFVGARLGWLLGPCVVFAVRRSVGLNVGGGLGCGLGRKDGDGLGFLLGDELAGEIVIGLRVNPCAGVPVWLLVAWTVGDAV